MQVADGVLVRRHDALDLSTGLVLGHDACLVIDTGGDEAWGAALATAVREVTALPWWVVLTHGHFDHCFGTAAFAPCAVHAQRGTPAYLRRSTAAQRAEWCTDYPGVSDAELVLPNRLVTDHTALDVGDRTVELRHLGPAHTDHDLVVHVPDARVVFAGDLVEQGAPPSVGPDSDPARWPQALERLLALQPRTVVPGHGEPVDAAFADRQRRDLLR